MIKQLAIIAVLAFICAASLSELSAQKKVEEHKIIIIEKEVDNDGNVVEKKIVKEGEEAKAYLKELEKNGETIQKWTTKDGEDLIVDGKSAKMIKKEQYKIKVKDDNGEEVEMIWDGEGEMPEEMKELMDEHDINISTEQKQIRKKIKVKKNGDVGGQEMEFEFDGEEIPDEVKMELEKHGIDLTEIVSADGEKHVKVVTSKPPQKAKKAQLGVNIEDHPAGVMVANVVEKSAAAEAGLLKGDVIYQIDDTALKTIEELVGAVGTYKPGDKINVAFQRNGENMSKTVTLKERIELYPFGTWEEVMNNKPQTIEIEIEEKIIKDK